MTLYLIISLWIAISTMGRMWQIDKEKNITSNFVELTLVGLALGLVWPMCVGITIIDMADKHSGG
jgi:hypothetical protein